MRRALCLIALLSLLALPAAADAATRIVVSGGGWGHGIGMSQYGAYGFALHDFSYREILAHYYRGSQLTTASRAPVRVLLQWSDPFVRFRGATRLAGVRDLKPRVTYVVRPSGGRLALYEGRRRVGRYARLRVYRRGRPVRLLGPTLGGVRDGRFRGSLDIVPTSGGVTAINRLGIDAYVRGVVAGEMPSSWHPEALKAQSVAARSYALATRKVGGLFDLFPDTRSQVYLGVAGERASTDAAVRATSRQVLVHDGEVAVTFFFSTSGGETENVENVFFGSLARPWLRGVKDPFDDISPRHRWRFRFTRGQMEARLGSYVRGRFRNIRVLRRGVSPRIIRARVHGTSGTRVITGPTLRARLGIYDSWAYFTRVSTARVRRSSFQALFAPPQLKGVFQPAPPRRRLAVERRSGRRWQRVEVTRTTRRGRYRVSVPRPGTYRVRYRSVAGPAVRAR